MALVCAASGACGGEGTPGRRWAWGLRSDRRWEGRSGVGRRRLALAAAAGESGMRGRAGSGEVACGDPMGAAPELRATEVSHCEVGLARVWPACHGEQCRWRL